MTKNLNENSELFPVIEQFENVHIAVIGDVMLDRFVYGQVKRISPESPVPVVNVKRTDYMLGGAGNVLANLSTLGVAVSIFGVIGEDNEGKVVEKLLGSNDRNTSYLSVEHSRPTTVKTRYLSGNQQLLRVDHERTNPVEDVTEENIKAALDKVIGNVQAIILSDYGKGVLSDELITYIIDKANKADLPVLVDPKGSDYSRYKGASVVTPNLNELEMAVGYEFERDDQGVVDAAKKLIEISGIKAVLATRSQDGMSVVEGDGKAPVHLRNRALEVYDVSGAGDTVIATLAAGLATGAPIELAASVANYAGGVVVGKVGTSPIRYSELEKALDPDDHLPHTAGTNDRPGFVKSWEEAQEIIQKWKRKGLRTGFTNGCFDIVHEGHTNYLAATKEHCDRLVLGLNCDTSVSRLKGPERPVNNETGRATVLAALASVDMVVLFGQSDVEDDKPVEIIKALQPDVFFKGGDYTEADLPEAPVVRAYGGDVKLMLLVDGVSTTSTIEKIKSA